MKDPQSERLADKEDREHSEGSIIPDPGARPISDPIPSPIFEPTSPPSSEIYDYVIADGETLFALNLDRIFEAVQDPELLLTVFWNITNDGVIWSSIDPGSGRFGTNILSMNVDSFVNNGLVVLETTGTIEFDAQLRLFNGVDQLRRFENNGEIYVINRSDNDTVENGAGINEASGFATSSVFDEEFINNGLFVVSAVDGQALGIIARNGANITNTVNGQILVEGAGALGVRNEFTLDESLQNFGLIHAVSISDQAAIGVLSIAATFINQESGVVTAEFAFVGSGNATNLGTLNGAVSANGFIVFDNGSTGEINGFVSLSESGDTLTNSGIINGQVFGGNGDDLIDNSIGTINGIVDLGLGADTFIGSSGQDLVAGDSGSDTIDGNDGNDLLLGGTGADILRGGTGNDGLYGEFGDDTILTQGGDHADGGAGDDTIRLGDYTFAFAGGGTGFDTLALADGPRALDVSAALASGRLGRFDQIELSGSHGLVIRESDISALTGGTDAPLSILTTQTDQIELIGAWTEGDAVDQDGTNFRSFTLSGVTVLIAGDAQVSVADTPSISAGGLDAIPDGEAAPEPGESTGLLLTPSELFIQGLEVREPTTIEADQIWFSTHATIPAVVSDVDGAHLTVEGQLLALNDISARATAVEFINLSNVNIEGLLGAYTTGERLTQFQIGTIEGAIAIRQANEVVNRGVIEAIGDYGISQGLGAIIVNPNGSFDLFSAVNSVQNFGTVNVRSGELQAFGSSGSTNFVNELGGIISVEGFGIAAGIVGSGRIVNHGTIEAAIDKLGTGESVGITVYRGGFQFTGDEGPQTVINTGTIRADVAVRVHSFLLIDEFLIQDLALAFENSGQAFGHVEGSNLDDTILNSGLIAGNVSLFGGDDVYETNGGSVTGLIDGGDGFDTAIFAGNFADFDVRESAIGEFTITGEGIDNVAGIERLRFNDVDVLLDLGQGISIDPGTDDPTSFMVNIRDFDGNDLGAADSWVRIGEADANLDGSVDFIFVNRENGRFAEVGVDANGLVQFDNHGQGGDTRVVGIYIDPLVEAGEVEQGGDFDSQRRFQNDLFIGNIGTVLGSEDYDGDGFAEIYFALTDGTAYLRALMHADGNIQYANYQSEEQVIEYLTANGYDETTFGDWFGNNAESAEDTVTFVADDEIEKQGADPATLVALHSFSLAYDADVSDFDNVLAMQQRDGFYRPSEEIQPEFFG
ncbi:hypothetical protein [Erythrobacter sp. Alg231-14]|uniref:hypothetical protein n=1 Tax=Erythrobacter sp. Alg231-14 TaxID=1922225 RepID=UPI00307C4F60